MERALNEFPTHLDQEGINALVGEQVFDPTSADQTSFDNDLYRNLVLNNGTAPDNSPPNATLFGGAFVFFLGADQGGNHENCWQIGGLDDNVVVGGPPENFLTGNDCP